MATHCDTTIGRRQFVTELTLGAFVATSLPFIGEATAQMEDPPNTHNMLVVGERTVFLSHLPMFAGLNKNKSAFVSPHRYQVIVEAAFTNQGKDVTGLYLKDRQAHPDTRIYTLGPEPFVLTRVFTPRDKPRLPAFSATVVRGHLEAPDSQPIPGLDKTSVEVKRVIHGRMFDPNATKPATLEYILFGTGPERYLAHTIFAAPDFDQVLAVTVSGVELTDKDLATELHVAIPARKNLVAERLRERERVEATLRIGPPGSPTKTVQLETGAPVLLRRR